MTPICVMAKAGDRCWPIVRPNTAMFAGDASRQQRRHDLAEAAHGVSRFPESMLGGWFKGAGTRRGDRGFGAEPVAKTTTAR